MKLLKTVIIDDETDSLSLLKLQLEKQGSQIGEIHTFSSPLLALQQIELISPDIVFLDIEMPEMNGFQFLEKLAPVAFSVVFVTAYNEFAIKAFKFSALDYLVKPVDIDDLTETVKKAAQLAQKPTAEQLRLFQKNTNNDNITKIAVNSLSGIIFIKLDDIVYIESSSNYSIFCLTDGDKVIVSKTLKDVHEILEERSFFRVHRQFIINLNKVKSFNKNDCILTLDNQKQLPVARIQKDKLIEKFGIL